MDMEKRIRKFGIFGILSLLSYTAMVVFSPLAYPGYDWLRMAVSELSADGAPSQALAEQLNALYGPCALVSIMAVCVGVTNCSSKAFRLGVYSFAGMQWLSSVGYTLFPWVSGADGSDPQNLMHLMITVLVVVLSVAALALCARGAKGERLKPVRVWALACLAAMLAGPLGTALLPASVFGLFERLSTFSAVVFNAALGVFLLNGTLLFEKQAAQ